MILPNVIYRSGSGVRQGDPVGPPSFQGSYDTILSEWLAQRRSSDWAQRLVLTYVLPDNSVSRTDVSTIALADDVCHFSAAYGAKELQTQLTNSSSSLKSSLSL